MTKDSRLHYAILLISIAVLPFMVHITRFEANEAHRAGLLGVLVLFTVPMIPTVIKSVPKSRRLLLFAIAIWCGVLVASSVFSIHPLRSLIGEGDRRMGLLTHLTFVAGAFLMWRVSGKHLWYFFWIVSVLGSVQVLLESQTLQGADRIYGFFGWTTFTGGWLALTTIWAVVGFLIDGYKNSTVLQRFVVMGSWGIIALAMVLLGTRAASLSLFIGLFVAGLVWTVLTDRRWILLGLVGITLLLASGVYGLSQINWGDSALSEASLFQRLNFQVFDPFRQEIWLDSQKILTENPTLLRYDGTLDPLSSLRPVLGYGAEAFEPPQRLVNVGNLKTIDDSIRTDRAHNLWYDTAIMHGGLGILAMLGVYLSALYVCLKQLRLLNQWVVIDMVGGGFISLLFTWGTQFIPMGMTIGFIGGLLVGIIQTGFISKFELDSIPSHPWLALSLLVAHIIEIQFGFVTIATTWIPWLAIGLLLFEEVDNPIPYSIPRWVWLTVAGAFILRMPLGNFAFNIMLLIVATLLTLLWARLTRNQIITLAIIWGLSASNWLIPIPQLAVLWDVALLGVMLWMFYGAQADSIDLNLNTSTLVSGLLIVIAVGIWGLDILSGVYRLQATQAVLSAERATAYNTAVRLRPYDDRLWFNAGITNLELGLQTNDGLAVGNAVIQLNQAVNLHGYYGLYVNNLARLEANLAIGTDNFETHAQLAQQYYERSVLMWSQVGEFWREWARFEWEIMGNADRAMELFDEAVRLDSNDLESQRLRQEIQGE